jgi:arylsulfatase A-like enzyme
MTGIATKMAAAGYHTAMYGKWDAGMATPDHTPEGRGYMEGMNYFHHDNDYWSMSYQLKYGFLFSAEIHTRGLPLSFHAFAPLEALPCV